MKITTVNGGEKMQKNEIGGWPGKILFPVCVECCFSVGFYLFFTRVTYPPPPPPFNPTTCRDLPNAP